MVCAVVINKNIDDATKKINDDSLTVLAVASAGESEETVVVVLLPVIGLPLLSIIIPTPGTIVLPDILLPTPCESTESSTPSLSIQRERE